MAPDHHLLQADFVGRVRVLAITPPGEEDEPTFGLSLLVLDTWYSRWEAFDELSFRVAPDAVLVSAQEEYVVLLTGGEYAHTPFTFREHSVFRVLSDDSVACWDTLPLFGVTSEGFHCQPREMVVGDPIDVTEMRRQFEARRERAATRHPELSTRRAEALAPRPTPGSEVRR
jgi:hypothetical protein